MKKSILVFIATVGFAFGSFAQGTVLFGNSSSSLVTYGEGASVGASLPANGSFSVALYWAPAGTTDMSAFVQLGASAGISPIAGRYSGGPRTTGAGTAAGTAGSFFVAAWSNANGSSYEQAAVAPGAWVGTSAIFSSLTGGAGDPPSNPVNLNTSVPGFTVGLVPVPEPSVIMLGLAGAGLLWFRRKK